MVLVVDSRIAGISGDMLLCSLVDMGADVGKITECAKEGARIAGADLDGLRFAKVQKCGISATKLELDAGEKCSLHTGRDVAACIDGACSGAGLSERARKFASESVRTLIMAESKVHEQPAESVHFHEMASFDTVLDIAGTAAAIDSLGLFGGRIVSTPVCVGGGSVTFSHGTVSNPGPAVLEIFRDSCMRVAGGGADSEMTTPTGACMLRNLASECAEFYPEMGIDAVGYGAGTKDFEGFANVLKLVRGKESASLDRDTVAVLETCIDDVSGEALGHAMERLLAAGARDVTAAPATGKKGRPANNVTVICDTDAASKLAGVLMSETGTLGVRMRTEERMIAKRLLESARLSVEGGEFDVRFKSNRSAGTFKIEADDIRAVSDHTGEPFDATERRLRHMLGGQNGKD